MSYWGEPVAAVIADSPETASTAADLVRVVYSKEAHDTRLHARHPAAYRPAVVSPGHESHSRRGDIAEALESAPYRIDVTYATPILYAHPMEPHSSLALLDESGLTLYDSLQGVSEARSLLAKLFGFHERDVYVSSRHVGGGFGSKGTLRAQAIVAVMGAALSARPVHIALTRAQMFELTGHRSPTLQRLQLGADGTGKLLAISHDVVEQTSTTAEFTQQTAVPSRMMYATASSATSHRLVPLDLPAPSWVRAPGVCPGDRDRGRCHYRRGSDLLLLEDGSFNGAAVRQVRSRRS